MKVNFKDYFGKLICTIAIAVIKINKIYGLMILTVYEDTIDFWITVFNFNAFLSIF